MFNALNHTNLGNPAASINVPATAGRIFGRGTSTPDAVRSPIRLLMAMRACAPLVIAGLLAGVLGLARAEPAVTVILGANVFDAIGGTMASNRSVLIEGDRIRAVAQRDSFRVPRGALVINAKGKYLIPGLIDGHVHLVHVPDLAHVTGDEILPLFLAYGVTTVRDTGDDIVAEKLISRYADAHPELSPRIMMCSPLVDSDPPFHRRGRVAHSASAPLVDPEKVPDFVSDMKGWGATTLKIYVGTERAVGRRVIEEGHRQGLVVTGHLGRYSAQDAVADGIDSLEHIWSVFNYILPPQPPAKPGAAGKQATLELRANADLDSSKACDLIAALAKRKVPVGPNLAVFQNMLLLNDLPEVHNHPDNRTVPARLWKYWEVYRQQSNLTQDTRELRRKEFKKYQELTGILHRAGVPILAGTDTPEPYVAPGSSLHTELELLVDSGLTPSAALQAATIENARIVRQAEHLGSISEGKLADIVILDADPLADIRNTRRIQKVLRGGILCDPKTVLRAVPAE